MKSNNCYKCKNIIKEIYVCTKCHFSFCRSECLINHFKLTHPERDKLVDISLSYSKKCKSILLKTHFLEVGTFLNMSPNVLTFEEFQQYEKIKQGYFFFQIGSGSYGDVFLVKHKRSNNFYAMKQVNKMRILSTMKSLDPIKKEIEIHSKLFHKNIIHLISTYEDECYIYLVMEYANKKNLYSKIKNEKNNLEKIKSEEECFKIFIQIVSAIFFMHSYGLIHRDIKPENILLNDKGEAKLCDFGCCAENSNSTINNRSTMCGTYEYMAPEIMREMAYNCSVDIWSLGILLYEMSHGYTPFSYNVNKGKKKDEILNEIMSGKLKINSPILGEEGKDLIRKMIVIDPKLRIKIEDIFLHPFIQKY